MILTPFLYRLSTNPEPVLLYIISMRMRSISAVFLLSSTLAQFRLHQQSLSSNSVFAVHRAMDGALQAPPSTATSPKLSNASPPTQEHFMLKDLDTGMKSFVTDTEWIEQPVVPSSFLSDPHSAGAADNPATLSTGIERGALAASVAPVATGVSGSVAGTRPPIAPHGPPRNAGRVRQTRRSRSDEASGDRRTLRPSDHVRVLAHKKREREFINLYRWQHIRAHTGAIRVLEFNVCGEWLASAGADRTVRIWRIDTQLAHSSEREEILTDCDGRANANSTVRTYEKNSSSRPGSGYTYIRNASPFVVCRGHSSDVTDLSWSKNDFLLSGSADRTMRLWHPQAKACLRRIRLNDIVTSVSFHPTDEQICIAGLSNGTVVMCHVKDGKTLSEADTDELVTATAITPDGTTALVGTLYGRCKFYALFDEIQAEWQFRHTTQLDVRSRRAKNAAGKKICGFRFYGKGDKVLVSSNDSRLRLFRLDDKSVLTKFVGGVNVESRLQGSFDPTGRYMLCATENRTVVIWDMPITEESTYVANSNGERSSSDRSNIARGGGNDDENQASFSAQSEANNLRRKDAGLIHESFTVQEKGTVTAAVFAPVLVPRDSMFLHAPISNAKTCGIVIITASDQGDIRVFGCC